MNSTAYVCSSCRMLYVPADDMFPLNRPQRRLMAMLMIADGAWVQRERLARICQRNVSGLVFALRTRRVAIESRHGGGLGGYRMVTLPPDWALDQVLATVHDLRRDESVRLLRVAS